MTVTDPAAIISGDVKLSLSARSPHAIDAHVGEKLRQRRTLLGKSQEALGEDLGLSFQQVQKYERGTNRISASRLFEISMVLGVPVTYFFEGMGADRLENKPIADDERDPLNRRETLELVRSYYRIQDETVRKRVYALVKALAGDVSEEDSASQD